jgi:hypothetical protein
MSKIEVNTVEPQCGTTLTLGGCGQTVALGSGASQTGFGRTGTVDWDTSIKTGTVTAVTGKGYFVDTTSGGITVNLPAAVVGSIVSVSDYASTSASNNITINPNGSDKINAVNDDYTISTAGLAVTLVYADAARGWKSVTGSDADATGLIPTFVTATVSGACNTLATAPDCANTKIATFLGPGTFCVSGAATCVNNNVVSYMVVAGGAGGGYDVGGGGGAGGFRETKSPVTPYTASPLCGYATPGNRITVSASPYAITVGGGGTAGAGAPPGGDGGNGNPTTFSTATSTGGGGGGGWPGNPGKTGGSGGGGSAWQAVSTGGSGNTPPTTPPQGNNGGSNPTGNLNDYGGAGGGATAVGANSANVPITTAGPVTAGATTSISASPVEYSRGGNGGNDQSTAASTHTAAANSADGGGGAGNYDTTNNGNAGGSGIVIIRYKFQ